MSPDAVLISRIQFAFTIGYHILWPAWTIGAQPEDSEAKSISPPSRARSVSAVPR